VATVTVHAPKMYLGGDRHIATKKLGNEVKRQSASLIFGLEIFKGVATGKELSSKPQIDNG
jgi:hypothetical protein